ncbi:hypothetical protein R1sor_018373 [Riccia sorocarpa]|uniref:Neurochondrin n=1 Tax=Riccia sorocarpa TaxID=122646 RepID=A0ABD3IAJ2_9MARC
MADTNVEQQARPMEASLDECLRLLRGGTDEQRFVGLLMVTKFVKGDDVDTVRKVFDAIGFQSIDRLIKSSRPGQEGTTPQQRSFLQLALGILAAFCRVPELASLSETISKIPLLVQTLANRDHEPATHDCLESLLLIATSSETGLKAIPMPQALPLVVHRLRSEPAAAPWAPTAVKLLHCLLTRIASENTIEEYAPSLTLVVLPVARQLSTRQDLSKFEALSVLYSLLVSNISMPIRAAMGAAAAEAEWLDDVRTGLGQILHSRIDISAAAEQKYIVLELLQAVVEIQGQTWLLGHVVFPPHPGQEQQPPHNRFFVLVVETLRVETAVLLNEVARMTFEVGQVAGTSKGNSVKERRLMSCFSLLEHIITIAAEQAENEEQREKGDLPGLLHDEYMISQKTLVALNEIIELVLEFLEDAEDHHQSEGETILACVRLASRFLAEVPVAHAERSRKLLSFMLSVTARDTERPFAAVQFMTPYLTQTTLTVEGCTALLSCNGHKKIVEYMAWTVQHYEPGCLVDICDILLNILIKKDEIAGLNAGEFSPVLPSFMAAVDIRLTDMESDMSAAICVSVMALTKEETLKQHREVGSGVFNKILRHICSTVERIVKGGGYSDEEDKEADLWDLVLSGCVICVEGKPSYPSLRIALHRLLSSLFVDRSFREQAYASVQLRSSMEELVRVLGLK